jgi:uncharacterized protein YjbJ (UPF0337 family)
VWRGWKLSPDRRAWEESLLLTYEGVATELHGKAQNGLGRLTGDGKLNEVKGKALDAYGRVIDGLDSIIDKTPPARGLNCTRRQPLLTTSILTGAAVLRLGCRR